MTRTDSLLFLRGLLPSVNGPSRSRLPQAVVGKLTADTIAAAHVPAGVHLALTGGASAVDLEVVPGAPTSVPAPTAPSAFVARAGSRAVHTAVPGGPGILRIDLPERGLHDVVRVYLPETVEVHLGSIEPVGGTIEPAARRPVLVAYGDSITQGWSVTEPGLAWPSLVAEDLGVDLVNLGFAGSARGELPAAEAVAASAGDVIALAWGTNAWSSLPTDEREIAERMRLFLTVVRQGLPDAPIVVISPIIRPEAETATNRFDTTHARLREALEQAVTSFERTGDSRILLVRGRDLVPSAELTDGIHPGDVGHGSLAAGVRPHIVAAFALSGRASDVR